MSPLQQLGRARRAVRSVPQATPNGPLALAAKATFHVVSNPCCVRPQGAGAAFLPPLLLAASTRLRRVWHHVACVRSGLGGMGDNSARYQHAISTQGGTRHASTILCAVLRYPVVYSSIRILPWSNRRRMAASRAALPILACLASRSFAKM